MIMNTPIRETGTILSLIPDCCSVHTSMPTTWAMICFHAPHHWPIAPHHHLTLAYPPKELWLITLTPHWQQIVFHRVLTLLLQLRSKSGYNRMRYHSSTVTTTITTTSSSSNNNSNNNNSSSSSKLLLLLLLPAPVRLHPVHLPHHPPQHQRPAARRTSGIARMALPRTIRAIVQPP